MKAKYFLIFGVVIIVITALALLFLDRGLRITSGDVVEKLRAASYLTTTKYTIQVVVRADTPGNWYALGQDYASLLLVAKGTVEAGIDLNQLDTSAVSVSEDGKSITVNLPPVMVRNRDYSLSNDPNDTYVYATSNGLAADKTRDLQTETRSRANSELVKAACKGGIMQRATTDAKMAIEQLLKTTVPNAKVAVVGGPVPPVEECTGE